MSEKIESEKIDSVVRSIIDKFVERSQLGKRKYGTDLDREDLTTDEWINHAQEELMDGILYLEKLKRVHSLCSSVNTLPELDSLDIKMPANTDTTNK